MYSRGIETHLPSYDRIKNVHDFDKNLKNVNINIKDILQRNIKQGAPLMFG